MKEFTQCCRDSGNNYIACQPNGKADALLTEEQRRQKIGDCLTQLAQRNPFFEIEDPVAWQREIRKDKPLLGRE